MRARLPWLRLLVLSVVVEDMAGAGSLIAASHGYRVVRPDGLTIVGVHGSRILGRVVGREGVDYS